MAQCRDLENHHHEKLLEISINTLEKVVKGELDEDLPEDVRAVSGTGGRRVVGVEAWYGPGQAESTQLCGSSEPGDLRGLRFLTCKREQ